jgi:regulator of cell morphogenesis and NO signaling
MLTIGARATAVDPRETVAEVARRSPQALAALQALGINHCCGGHLSLTEASAAAGVPVEDLIAAVGRALGSPDAAR